MKILHLISGGDSGGAKTHVHLLLKHLGQTADTEVRLICFTEGDFSREAAALGIPTEVLPVGPFRAARLLRRRVAEEGYDLIHCHGARGNFVGALLKPRVSVPVLTTVHSDPRLDYLGRLAARLSYGTLNALALRRIRYHVGVSDAMVRLLTERGMDPTCCFPIYNGVEFDAAAAEAFDRRAYLETLGLKTEADSVVAGIAARLHPVKDLPTLLRGFRRAHDRCPRLRLVIAGDGQDREALLALAKELGVAEAVCFAGWQKDMRRFYRALDINVLTSRSETFPYAVTEAAREHLPTVSTPVGGIPALISHGETGLLFPIGDWAALGDALASLAEAPELRKRLGDAIYEKARAEFSAEATARRQREIYESILRREAAERTAGRCGVLICGAYGMGNAGDEAVLDAIVSELRRRDRNLPISVMTRRRKETALRFGVDAVHSFDLPRIFRRMRCRTLFLNGGGSLLQDVTSTRSLLYYLLMLRAAKRRGCKVMMYGCGVGPVNRRLNRRLTGKTVDACVDAITLRERGSLEELRRFGVTKPEILPAADPALLLEPAPDGEIDAILRRAGLEPGERCFCVSLRSWPGVAERLPLFAAAADYAWQTYGLRPVLLSVNARQDDRTAERLMALLRAPAVLIAEELTTAQTVGLVGRMEAVMAMRLHVLIFAASRAVPLAAVSYDPKVSAFLRDLGQTNCVELSAVDGEAALFRMVDAAVRADRAQLREKTEEIRELERRSGDTALRLLGKETDPQ